MTSTPIHRPRNADEGVHIRAVHCKRDHRIMNCAQSPDVSLKQPSVLGWSTSARQHRQWRKARQ